MFYFYLKNDAIWAVIREIIPRYTQFIRNCFLPVYFFYRMQKLIIQTEPTAPVPLVVPTRILNHHVNAGPTHP